MLPEVAVRQISEKQHGTVTRSQALAVGMTSSAIERRVSNGMWTRLAEGVYLLHGRSTPLAMMAAATVALPAVISHEAAADLHGLKGVVKGRAVVTVPHRMSNRFTGVEIHESTDLQPGHITTVDHLPVTTVPRTLFDLSIVLGHRQLMRVVDNAISTRQVQPSDLAVVLAEIGRRGRPGTTRFRQMVAELAPGYVAPESELERRMIDLLELAGFPPPVRQSPFPWRTSVDGRLDLVYPESRVIIECDGRRWHTTAEAFERDRRRDNLAQLNGWLILRFTWTDTTRHAHVVVEQVRQALALREAV